MKVLSVIQPFANLIAMGAKTIESRRQGTTYRGPLAIYAERVFPEGAKGLAEFCSQPPYAEILARDLAPNANVDRSLEWYILGHCAGGYLLFPVGCIVAVADLWDCQQIGNAPPPTGIEAQLGDYTPGRWMWRLANVRRLFPPIRCQIGLWDLAPEIERMLEQEYEQVGYELVWSSRMQGVEEG